MSDVSRVQLSGPALSGAAAAACAACTAGGIPSNVQAAAAARFLKSLDFSVAATAASAKAAAPFGGFPAEVDVVVTGRNHRVGIDLHRRARKNIAFPGLHIGAGPKKCRAQ